MIRITAIYPNADGSRFDAGYYAQKHKALAEQLLGPHGLVGLSQTFGVEALDGTPPPFWAIGEMIFTSREAFEAAMQSCGAALFADSVHYTDVTPVLQVSRAADAFAPSEMGD
jgi:uncharacterized protein (TIGR02118 family)